MSSLLQQLTRLQAETVKTTGSGMAKHAPTLIFGDKAKQIPLRVIHEISSAALLELQGYDQRFCKFEKSLFGREAVEYDRDVHTAQENTRIDSEMAAFLDLLVPWLDLGAAPRALEFLIRRYRLDLVLGDRLLMVFLPYHETSVFRTLVDSLSATANTPDKIKQDSLLGIIGTAGWPAPRQALRPALLRNSCSLLGKLRGYLIELAPLPESQAFYARFLCALTCDLIREGSRSWNPDTAKGKVLLSQIEELARYCCNRKRQSELRYLGFAILLTLAAAQPEAVAESRVLKDCLAQLLDAPLERPGMVLHSGAAPSLAASGLTAGILATPTADSARVLLSLAKTLTGTAPALSPKMCGKALLVINTYLGECVSARTAAWTAAGVSSALSLNEVGSLTGPLPTLPRDFLALCEQGRAFFMTTLEDSLEPGPTGGSGHPPLQQGGDKQALVATRARELSQAIQKMLEAEGRLAEDGSRDRRASSARTGQATGLDTLANQPADLRERQPLSLGELLALPLRDLQRRAAAGSGPIFPLAGLSGLAHTLSFAWLTGVGGEAGKAAAAWVLHACVDEILAFLNVSGDECLVERVLSLKLLSEAQRYSSEVLSSGRLSALSEGFLLEGVDSLERQDSHLSGRAGSSDPVARREFWAKLRQKLQDGVALSVSHDEGDLAAPASSSVRPVGPSAFLALFLSSLSRIATVLDSGAQGVEFPAHSMLSSMLHEIEANLAQWSVEAAETVETVGASPNDGLPGEQSSTTLRLQVANFLSERAKASRKVLLDEEALVRSDYAEAVSSAAEPVDGEVSDPQSSHKPSFSPLRISAALRELAILRDCGAEIESVPLLAVYITDPGALAHTDPVLARLCSEAGGAKDSVRDATAYVSDGPLDCGALADVISCPAGGWERGLSESPRVLLQCLSLRKRKANGLAALLRVLLARASDLALRGAAFSAEDEEKEGAAVTLSMIASLLARAYGDAVDGDGLSGQVPDSEDSARLCNLTLWNPDFLVCTQSVESDRFLRDVARPWVQARGEVSEIPLLQARLSGEGGESLEARARLEQLHARLLAIPQLLELCIKKLDATTAVSLGYDLLGGYYECLSGGVVVEMASRLVLAGFGGFGTGERPVLSRKHSDQDENSELQALLLVQLILSSLEKASSAPREFSEGDNVEDMRSAGRAESAAHPRRNRQGEDDGMAENEFPDAPADAMPHLRASLSGSESSEPATKRPSSDVQPARSAALPPNDAEAPKRDSTEAVSQRAGLSDVPASPALLAAVRKAEAVLSSAAGDCTCHIALGMLKAIRDGRVSLEVAGLLLAALCSELSSPHFIGAYLSGVGDKNSGSELLRVLLGLRARYDRSRGSSGKSGKHEVSAEFGLLSQTCKSLSELLSCETIVQQALRARQEALRGTSLDGKESLAECVLVASEAYSLLNDKLTMISTAMNASEPQLRGEILKDVSATCSALCKADDEVFYDVSHVDCLLTLLSSFPQARVDLVEASAKLLRIAHRAWHDVAEAQDTSSSKNPKVSVSDPPAGDPRRLLALTLLSLVQIVDQGKLNLIPRIPGLFLFCLDVAEAKASLYAARKNAAAFTEDTVAVAYLLLALLRSYSRFASPYISRIVVCAASLSPRGYARFSGMASSPATADDTRQGDSEEAIVESSGDDHNAASCRPNAMLPAPKNELTTTSPNAAQVFRVTAQLLTEVSRAFPLQTVLNIALAIVAKIGTEGVRNEVALYSICSLAWKAIERMASRKTALTVEDVKTITKFVVDCLRARSRLQDALLCGQTPDMGDAHLLPLLAGFEIDRFESAVGLIAGRTLSTISTSSDTKLLSLPLDILLSWPGDETVFGPNPREKTRAERRGGTVGKAGALIPNSTESKGYMGFFFEFAEALDKASWSLSDRFAIQVLSLLNIEQHVSAVVSAGKWPLGQATSLLHVLAVMAGNDPDELFSLVGNRIYPLISQLVVFIGLEMPRFQTWAGSISTGVDASIEAARSEASNAGGAENRDAPLAVCVAPAGLALAAAAGLGELPWGYHGYVQLLRYAMLVLFAMGQADEVVSSDMFPKVCDFLLVVLGSPTLCALQRFPEYVYAGLESVLSAAGGLSTAPTLWGGFHERLLKLIEASGVSQTGDAPGSDPKACRARCVESLAILYNVADQETLALLPQSLGLITELLEDTDPWISKAARKLVKVIEQITGEPFAKLLS